MRNREGVGSVMLYVLGIAGILAVLVINSHEQRIGLFSWQNAALIGYAALVALVTALVVRAIRNRV